MVVKQRSLGGDKACRIHDLIHDFCIQKVKKENFFLFLKGYNEFSAFKEPHNLQRLCIHSEVDHFKLSKFCFPHARSLIFNSSQSTDFYSVVMRWLYIPIPFHNYKLLSVLDFEQVNFGHRFPSEIELLVQLAFLAIQSQIYRIPSWIGNLSNLETLIIFNDRYIGCLPETLWNLQKLRYLYLRVNGDYYFPEGILDNSSTLNELDRISGVSIPYSAIERLLRKFPDIRKLKCKLRWNKDDNYHLVVPNFLSRIESLDIHYQNEVYLAPVVTFDQFSLPTILKKLTLHRFSLSWRNISTIGELPNLEVLKFLWITFEGETWEMKVGEFSKLKILKLADLEFVKWRTDCDDHDQLNCLQKLVMDGCWSLEEVPCCLENISTLEIIEICHCPYNVVDMVKQTAERREEFMGNSNVRIITNRIWNG